MSRRGRLRAFLSVLGPGLIAGFADNDAQGISQYSVAGAQFGFGLMWALLVTTLALIITQEQGARLGLATSDGLAGVIRERFGVRWTGVAVLAMLIANLGTTVADFAGFVAALKLFGVPALLSSIVAASLIVLLLARGHFAWIQYMLIAVGVVLSAAYAGSAYQARPDWGSAALSLVLPGLQPTSAYFLTLVAVVGTTITPWGQAFIQSYVVDKRLGPRDLGAIRVDVVSGSILTNLVAAFIVIACASTIFASGGSIEDAADAARALGPLVGSSATVVFAIGLTAGALLGLSTVPLTSAYFACEAFGFERGLHWKWRQAPLFYGLLTVFIASSALFVVIPGLPLLGVIVLSNVLNGVLLPVILIFVMLVSREPRIGQLRAGRIRYALGWAVTGMVSLMSLLFVGSLVLGV